MMSEYELEVADGDWPEDDRRWQMHRRELFTAIRSAPDTSVRPASGAGRGAAETVIVALGSAGGFTAMIEIIKAWISTRPRRKVVIKKKDGDTEIEITMENASDAELKELLR
jgi:hypothetical protein